MIITFTPNPALDHTIVVHRLRWGDVNRFQESHLDPAGKGINVSRMVHRLGWPTIAFAFTAGEIGEVADKALRDEGVQHYFVPVVGQTRINVTVADRDRGLTTSLYGPGPAVDAESLHALEGLLRFWLQAGRVLVLAGSLPAGVPDGLYAEYVRLARQSGVQTILDADDEPFRHGVAAVPTLIKPNLAEAERLLGRNLSDLPAVVAAARELVGRGIEVVVISMGAQGAVCASRDGVWRAVPPHVERRSTVGSGDSLVAGLAVALARGDDITEGLRVGTAAGAATAMSPGTALGTPAEVAALLPQVRITAL